VPKEYYEILDVPEDASQEQIKKQYRKKAKKYHPDSNSDTADEEKFKQINKAYDVLSDEEKRKKYDQFGKQGVEGQASRGRRQAASNFQDIFEQIFGGGRQQQSRGPASLKIRSQITLEQAYNGTQKTFDVQVDRTCQKCNGKGGQNTSECSQCNGSGTQTEVRRTPLGRARQRVECSACNGKGFKAEDTCSQCGGQGINSKTETVEVDIPQGIRDGQKVRIRGKGDQTRNGKTGDIILTVEVEPHDYLERRENDLFTEATIGVKEAAEGTSIIIPHPDEDIKVHAPQGSQPGQVLKVDRKGFPGRRSNGDLFVKLNVSIPEEPSKLGNPEKLSSEPELSPTFFETVKDVVN
jgi:molecular chaperone DnaJ